MTRIPSRLDFDWNSYLNLACELVQSNNLAPKEEHFRSAISRAYYAAFCRSRNYLIEKRDLTIPNHDAHSAVINHFKNGRSASIPRKVGDILFNLRDKRNDADYKDCLPNSAATAKIAIKDAQKIIEIIDGLYTNAP